MRTNSTKPTVVKLHGDAHLDPKNLEPETSDIDIDLCRQLYPFLQDQAMVFIGYGGNDESILKFVQNCPIPALAPPIFWVSKQEPPIRFSQWLQQRSALRVDHTDFDQLMHLVRNSLGIELLDQKRWNQIGDRYYQTYERLKKVIERLPTSSEDSDALKDATSSTEKSLPDDWAYHSRAESLRASNIKQADRTYREGLTAFPDSTILNCGYATFLHDKRIDADRAETFFKRAIEIDPTDEPTLSNYATFLLHERKDLVGAELMYRRAMEADPVGDDTLGNYAQLLLAKGQKNEAKALIDRIGKNFQEFAASKTLGIELLIYQYAHQLGKLRDTLSGLKKALSTGKRSPNWNFDLNFNRAEEEGHPNLGLLRDLILVATNKAPLSTLDSHKDWLAAKASGHRSSRR